LRAGGPPIVAIMHGRWLLNVVFNCGRPDLGFFRDHFATTIFFDNKPGMVSLDSSAAAKPTQPDAGNKLVYFALDRKTKGLQGKSRPGVQRSLVWTVGLVIHFLYVQKGFHDEQSLDLAVERSPSSPSTTIRPAFESSATLRRKSALRRITHLALIDPFFCKNQCQ
jgi:hypothetical protein